MRRFKIGCLPVVDDEQLVGIVTSYDFLTATAGLFKQHLAGSATSDYKPEAQAASA
jgi:CBS domain-containing protein